MKKDILKEYKDIEKEFFDIDEEKKLATIRLSFKKPSELFDGNHITQKPVFKNEFVDKLNYCFNLIPSKYDIGFEVEFEDLDGYNEESLQEIFYKNVLLHGKFNQEKNKRRTVIGLMLTGLGILFLLTNLLIDFLWVTDSVFRKVFMYVADILATVSIWEAFTLMVVEKHVNRIKNLNTIKRFRSIKFSKKA